jgi:hypothetical protein
VFAFGDHHTSPGPQVGAEDDADRTELSTLLLKWFFVVVALCLVVSTACGIWMGLTQIRARRLAWLLLVAGTAIPAGLLLV